MVSDLRGESSTNTDAKRIRFLSNAERDVAKRKLFQYFLLPNQTATGDGNNDYAIGSSTYPMRFKGLSEVFVGGTTEDKRYAIVDYHRFKNEFNKNNAARLCYEWYDAANDLWKVHISPAPETGVTIYYSYYWEPPKRTSSSDEVICPDMRILALYVLADLLDSEDDTNEAANKRGEAEQLVSEIIGKQNSPAVNQTYSFSSIYNSVKNQPLGSY